MLGGMSFIETPAESPLYDADLASQGYVSNYVRVLAHRPDVVEAWKGLSGAAAATWIGAATSSPRWRRPGRSARATAAWPMRRSWASAGSATTSWRGCSTAGGRSTTSTAP